MNRATAARCRSLARYAHVDDETNHSPYTPPPMRYLASFVVTLAWALWLGGMVALVIFVQTLFARNRPIALDAAPMLFVAFERVQLLLAAAAVVGTFCWWLLTRRRAIMILFALLAISGAIAAMSTTLNTAPMEQLRAQGLRESPEFQRLHRRSTRMYMAEMLMLLAAGAIIARGSENVIRPHRNEARLPDETGPDTAAG